MSASSARHDLGVGRHALLHIGGGQVKQPPGFIKGYWAVAADHTNGLSLVVFNTKAEAENASQMARTSPTPPGVTINHVEIREVVADA